MGMLNNRTVYDIYLEFGVRAYVPEAGGPWPLQLFKICHLPPHNFQRKRSGAARSDSAPSLCLPMRGKSGENF